MDGALVIDKPPGLTSHDVVAVARRLLHEPRMGHAGTLDPLATGVLVLACGRATRLVRFLSASEKRYDATMVFGVTTDTYDVTGTETSRSDARPTREALDEAVASLCGSYLQEPPAFSAKKVAGTRAYTLARQQKPVALTAVPVHVAQADVLTYDGERATVTLRCSAGFYVRSFAQSLGRQVGAGACLEALRRTGSGDFTLDDAVSMEQLHEGMLEKRGRTPSFVRPLDRLMTSVPAVRLTEEGLVRVTHGRPLEPHHLESDEPGAPRASDAGEWVRLLTSDGRLVAMAERRPESALHPSIVLI